MSLFSTMRTSVSGMAAQSNALSTIGDNIANTATTGYKAANAQFETVLGQNSSGNYESGGVQTDVRYGISDQGTMVTTTSTTDLAVNGNGFFVVSKNGESAGNYLTRAGSFVPDQNGNLVNSAGYNLMGFPINPDGTTSPTLQKVNVASNTFQVASSTTGVLTANLNSQATAVASTPAVVGPPAVPASGPPSYTNSTSTQYTSKTSMTVFDNLGTSEVLDVYFTKLQADPSATPPVAANTWEVDVYQQSKASPSGGFPYTGSPMVSQNMTFDGTTGALTNSGTLNVQVPNGNLVAVDISGTTQLATDFGVSVRTMNGNAPSKLDHVTIGKDGTLTDVYASGIQIKSYQIPLATVASANNLTPISGNVYQVSESSGDIILNVAGTNGAGAIDSDTLEQSTVDLASELTNMIQAQRAYEANSKVLQAGSDLLGVLNRLSTN